MNYTKTFCGLALGMMLSFPVVAGHCPADAKSIDQALTRSSLGANEKQAIQKLRDDGMALHQSGDHRGSEKNMAEAMRRLLAGSIN